MLATKLMNWPGTADSAHVTVATGQLVAAGLALIGSPPVRATAAAKDDASNASKVMSNPFAILMRNAPSRVFESKNVAGASGLPEGPRESF
jgi:hypothetical protein